SEWLGETTAPPSGGGWYPGFSSASSSLLKRLWPKSAGADLPRLSQHLVHFAGVQLLGVNHLTRIFFEHHRAPFDGRQQPFVEDERRRLMLHRLDQNFADVVLVAVEQAADPKKG